MFTRESLVYEQLFSVQEVDAFCDRYRDASFEPAVIRNRQNIDVADHSKRKSDRIYLPFQTQDSFISKLTSFVVRRNEIHFKYPNLYYTNDWELLRYGPGDFFKRHHDRISEQHGPFVSAVVYLQNQEEFEGGQTLFYNDHSTSSTFTIDQKKGYVVLYPSNIYHEVTPLTKGTRLTLVNFFSHNKR
jgi:PKHD-type hydroxylase